MDALEVRLRCIEAAAKFPSVHLDGPAAGVLDTAQKWAAWVLKDAPKEGPNTLHLNKK